TEYGVTVSGPGDVSPVLVASMLVGQYGQAELRRVKWDFQEENPLRDARGFEGARNREAAEEEGALVNLVLTNGARYYVDHAHPERFRRVHVICGDATMCEVTTFLKVGTTALVLMLVEDEVLDPEPFTLASGVESFKVVSRDTSLQSTIELKDGRRVTAV